MSRDGVDDVGRAIERAAELRELVREANAAVRDLAPLLRELRQLRAAMPAAAEDYLAGVLNAHTDEISELLNERTAETNTYIAEQERQTRAHYQALLSQDVKDLILRTCGIVLHLTGPSITVEEWMAQLTREADRHRAAGCTCNGCGIVASPPVPAAGRVFVVTDPRDAPPGTMIIDAR